MVAKSISHHLRNPGMIPLSIPTKNGFNHGFKVVRTGFRFSIHSMSSVANHIHASRQKLHSHWPARAARHFDQKLASIVPCHQSCWACQACLVVFPYINRHPKRSLAWSERTSFIKTGLGLACSVFTWESIEPAQQPSEAVTVTCPHWVQSHSNSACWSRKPSFAVCNLSHEHAHHKMHASLAAGQSGRMFAFAPYCDPTGSLVQRTEGVACKLDQVAVL